MSIRQANRIRRLVDERDRALVGYRVTSRKLAAAVADRDRWKAQAEFLADGCDGTFLDQALAGITELVEEG